MIDTYQAIAHHITQLLVAKDFIETTVCQYGRLSHFIHFNPDTGAIIRINFKFYKNQFKIYANSSKHVPWATSATKHTILKSLSVDITSPDFLDKIEQFFDVVLI